AGVAEPLDEVPARRLAPVVRAQRDARPAQPPAALAVCVERGARAREAAARANAPVGLRKTLEGHEQTEVAQRAELARERRTDLRLAARADEEARARVLANQPQVARHDRAVERLAADQADEGERQALRLGEQPVEGVAVERQVTPAVGRRDIAVRAGALAVARRLQVERRRELRIDAGESARAPQAQLVFELEAQDARVELASQAREARAVQARA